MAQETREELIARIKRLVDEEMTRVLARPKADPTVVPPEPARPSEADQARDQLTAATALAAGVLPYAVQDFMARWRTEAPVLESRRDPTAPVGVLEFTEHLRQTAAHLFAPLPRPGGGNGHA